MGKNKGGLVIHFEIFPKKALKNRRLWRAFKSRQTQNIFMKGILADPGVRAKFCPHVNRTRDRTPQPHRQTALAQISPHKFLTCLDLSQFGVKKGSKPIFYIYV